MTDMIQEPRKGRDWFGVDVNRVLAVEWMALPRGLLGHWLVLHAYLARQSTEGRIRRSDGKPLKAFRNLGIGTAVLQALLLHGLVRQDGTCLEVVGYDRDREKRFHAKSEKGRARSNRRWGSGGEPSIDGAGDDGDIERGNEDCNACGHADQRREHEKDPPIAPRGGDDAGGDGPEGFLAFWEAVPPSLQQRRSDAVREWRNLGLDQDRVAQQRILKALEWQRKSAGWVAKNRELHLTPKMYLRKRRWEDGPALRAERAAGPANIGARAVDACQTPEEMAAKFRAHWEADPDNAGKACPSSQHAVAEVSHSLVDAAGRGTAQ
jgi:hypothetical protein